eukprot:Rhum_TRINITY_DN10975_c0_g1::Rhum_TRINITY_DN10975_c0_g1_i1::g.41570::m.41570
MRVLAEGRHVCRAALYLLVLVCAAQIVSLDEGAAALVCCPPHPRCHRVPVHRRRLRVARRVLGVQVPRVLRQRLQERVLLCLCEGTRRQRRHKAGRRVGVSQRRRLAHEPRRVASLEDCAAARLDAGVDQPVLLEERVDTRDGGGVVAHSIRDRREHGAVPVAAPRLRLRQLQNAVADAQVRVCRQTHKVACLKVAGSVGVEPVGGRLSGRFLRRRSRPSSLRGVIGADGSGGGALASREGGARCRRVRHRRACGCAGHCPTHGKRPFSALRHCLLHVWRSRRKGRGKRDKKTGVCKKSRNAGRG